MTDKNTTHLAFCNVFEHTTLKMSLSCFHITHLVRTQIELGIKCVLYHTTKPDKIFIADVVQGIAVEGRHL